jgi:DNA-binding FadR family transcriptional regulator
MSPDGGFRDVVRNPAYRQVADQLRDAIVDGRFRPGDELPTERDLALQFAVSRTTVREALRSLQAQALIEVRASPFRPVVSAHTSALADAFGLTMRMGHASVLDLIQFRTMIELEAIDHAVRDRDPTQWGAVGAALDAMRTSTSEPDPFHHAYVTFHLELARVAANAVVDQLLVAVFDALHDHFLGAFRQFVERGSVSTMEELVGHHGVLLAALEQSDGPRARAAMSVHSERLYTRLLETAPPRFAQGEPVEP